LTRGQWEKGRRKERADEKKNDDHVEMGLALSSAVPERKIESNADD
jgi:hypothetical protein